MASSDSDSIFLTQNTFRSDTSDDSANLSDSLLYIDELQPKVKTKYEPIVSDISDDELIAATLVIEEEEKAKCRPTALANVANTKRFKEPKADSDLLDFGRRRFAESTERKIRWAVDLFRDWQMCRNQKAVSDVSLNISPINVDLNFMTKDEVNYSLARFICEVKKKNGDDYPGETLHELVISIQLYFDLRGKSYKFLSDPDFLQLRNTLDGLMKERAKAGLGIRRKQAEEITVEEEESLWQKQILGSSSPSQLLNTLVYSIGLNFALRGGQEHRNLRWKSPQLQILIDGNGDKFLRYTEDASKTNQGDLKHRHIKPKVVDAYESKVRERCIVTLFEEYERHCPPEDQRPDAFYLRPLAQPRGQVWYAAQPLGRHKLAQVVAEVCRQGGLAGYRTNHSLRASAASRLYRENVDEQLICEVTGHRSNTVRNYKRTSENLKRKINSVIQGRASGTVACTPSAKKLATSTATTPSGGTGTDSTKDSPRNFTVTVNVTLVWFCQFCTPFLKIIVLQV
ncbi:zinc finger MYM-type protein 2-like isoform X3 [Patiria miniata]|uniref:DUF3504 domain-containing protein n=1 Tax=Patiria miniata TaxID=46514 RepID=A0A914AYM9_PATMI|nr:zinc finger MYM-type protein 2-like isoform X3 [Patiria miniata]